MKKLLCFLLCLTLILSSISLSFATPVQWDSSDSQHLTEIRNTLMSGGIYNLINSINSNIVALDNHVYQIYQAIDPSSSGSTASILNKILSVLSYTDAGGALKSWLADIWQLNSVNLPRINDIFTLDDVTGFESTAPGGYKTYKFPAANGGSSNVRINYGSTNWRKNLLGLLNYQFDNITSIYQYTTAGYANTQTVSNWHDLDSNYTFSGSSAFDTVYKWLSYIQTPVARLSYVLASDERIEAQEAAAANEEAVVDNFINSSGDGAASTSDIGSVSNLSSGYKQNFGSDASPSGIFDIFNSDHATWFSQETKNQLDTTTPSRMTKGSVSETPLLDKKIEDIYDALGVKQP